MSQSSLVNPINRPRPLCASLCVVFFVFVSSKSQDVAGGEDLAHCGVVAEAVDAPERRADLVTPIEHVPERVHEARDGVRQHNEFRRRLRRLDEHEHRVQEQRQRDILEVVAVDVV